MKKAIVHLTLIFACLLSVLPLSGCEQGAPETDVVYYDDGSSLSKNTLGQDLYSIAALPFTMSNGEVDIPLNKVSFWELYSDHGYAMFVIVSLGRGNLSDDDLYWMTNRVEAEKDPEIHANVYISDEKNELESERISLVGKSYDKENFYFVFCGNRERYALDNSSISVQVIISPDGSVMDESTSYYHFKTDLNGSDDYQSLARLTDGERNALSNAVSD